MLKQTRVKYIPGAGTVSGVYKVENRFFTLHTHAEFANLISLTGGQRRLVAIVARLRYVGGFSTA